ncbi:tRNA pseudouridine(55) synthase TruB [Idiomarina xiamenensis]|uniref:tRNA pseudouridine synthase B n=1 Tax=Idiomarina xiamenensis 10-D-4 TaxID=740709 RepID=K2KQZ7_9GAMM|nr:tRNA pseudouridine(55) synthase TruB [Idiomarina xiamenensis]EKE79925.1 tRNA pseudouridine 5S synthase [Idiomarina xiamenensis 10-D-4]
MAVPAKANKGRPVNGVVLLDKPQGLSSNRVLQRVKRLFNASKAGHTGALDPIATGMLPICLGEATKFSQYMLDADKRYQVLAKFGERTTTSDCEGEVVESSASRPTQAQLQQALSDFIGRQKQSPSLYSALKYQGRPLYEYARKGIDVPRKIRDITIYDIKLLSVDGDSARLDVSCSKGTYIRTLIDDLGQQLGCGAHVAELHRSAVAGFEQQPMYSFEQLLSCAGVDQAEFADADLDALDQLLLPCDATLVSLPEYWVDSEVAEGFFHGMPVRHGSLRDGDEYRIKCQADGRFLGTGLVRKGGDIWPKRVVI